MGALDAGDSVVPAAALPQTILGPEQLISEAPGMPEFERFGPDIAYNWVRGESLVVWHNMRADGKRDIYARRVADDGRLLSWFAITSGGNDRAQPAVAFNAGAAEYLVVWMHDVSGNGTQYEIWGRIVAWDNNYQKPEFQIISWPARTFWTPRVVHNHNRNQYLVVWNAFDTSTLLPNDVSSMLLDADGGLIQGRNLTTSTFPHQADVTYNWQQDSYYVVFVRSYTQVTTGNDVYGLRVTAENAVDGGVIAIEDGTQNQDAPRVVTDGKGKMMVIWQHEHNASDRDIFVRKLLANGNPDGAKWVLTNSPDDETSPALAASYDDSPSYMAVWQRQESSGDSSVVARYWGDGLLTRYVNMPGGSFWESADPDVGFIRPSYYVVYEGDSTSNPTVLRQIYGRKWAPHVALVPVVRR
jgi:hypothetical protein